MSIDITHFPVTVSLPLQWGEMDAFQHLNNTVYFRYFETARIAYFDKMGWFPIMEVQKIGPILASTSARYKQPLYFPDVLEVGARVTELGEDFFTMQYAVYSQRLKAISTVGEGRIVVLNYVTHQKTVLPSELKEKILSLEKEEVVIRAGIAR